MFLKRKPVPVMVMVILGFASACSSTPKVAQMPDQNDAIARWNRCIERFSAEYQGSASTVGRRANAYCEGHRRDVVATFPPYLENQIDTLLSQRATAMTTARFIKTAGDNAWDESKGAQLDTLKKRLIEARQADL